MIRVQQSKRLFTLAMVLLAGGCVLPGAWPQQQGQVLDEKTGRPIAGAIVVARWKGCIPLVVECQGTCFHVETAVTDADGRYRIPPYVHGVQNIKNRYVDIVAYKSGYRDSQLNDGTSAENLERIRQGLFYLVEDTGSREERLRRIAGAAATCGGAGESRKNLLTLYRNLYDDVRPLTVTKEDKVIENNLLYKIDLVELPYEDVLKRVDERNKALREEYPDE